MVQGVTGWMFILVYLALLAVVVLAFYYVVRLAVTHALKTHTRWVDAGKP